MRIAHRCIVAVAPIAVLLACDPEPVGIGAGIQAHAFANSGWSEPVNLGAVVNSSAVDANAGLSPDEHTLYFVSSRLGGMGGNDIWMSRRQCLPCPWNAPVNLGARINTAAGEGAPTLSENGKMLFFFSGRPGGQGNFDLYVSHRIDQDSDGEVWGEPVNLGPYVNTTGPEQGSYYVREGGVPTAVLYFNRAADIYRVAVTNDGAPLGPALLVAELSDPIGFDQKVTVRTDGLELLLSSTRAGTLGSFDLWVSTRGTPRDPWSTPSHLAGPLNTPDIDSQPNLSRDGRTLIFTSSRSGGSGGNDLWMATRSASGTELP